MYSDKKRLICSEMNNDFYRGDDVLEPVLNREPNKIVGVFVVDFHNKKGNMVEWCFPDDINFTGIEFKALVSGAHSVQSDFVFFRHQNYFGVGSFANRSCNTNIAERGFQMKTAGLLCTQYENLEKYIDFLDGVVRNLLINPGIYDRLVAFYADQQNQSSSLSLGDIKIFEENTQFDINAVLQLWGVHLMSLWKLVMLRKRLLFISSPPIGSICQQVGFCHRLGSHSVSQWQYLRHRLLCCISVADLDSPGVWQSTPQNNNSTAFLACSTDRVLEYKQPQRYYDCLVTNVTAQDSKVNLRFCEDDEGQSLRKAVTVTSSDCQRWQKLKSISDSFDHSGSSWENCVVSFFQSENDQMLQALFQYSQTSGSEITSAAIERLGFHPHDDRDFLVALLEAFGVDVVLEVEPDVCC